ncbi:glycoside hydrolase family protein [Paraferrimonas sp. SM1919]|uniref:glycoside hydrolase family protein n=1 Tax=Paraferrimonas sp. SM1919 TaxID=2662263 RepID=UPI0013D61EE8|nr:glycoside hydrolase family protein [Paraferrimonas sp. SM1919]
MKKTLCLSLVAMAMMGCSETKPVVNMADIKPGVDDLNLAELIQPVTDKNIFTNDEWHNWGASIIKGEDGKYHSFYSQMSKELGFSTWLTDGVISHAVADSPEGPWTHVEVVLEGRGHGHWDAYTAHNPRIKFFDGKYYLYYMSTNTGDTELSPEEFELARKGKLGDKYRDLVRENQRVGVAVADSINGPWKRFDKPIIEPSGPIEQITCNPAVAKRPDGKYVMLVRGDKPNQEKLVRSQAVALADSPMGPWQIQPKAAVGNLNSEDPALWYDETRNRFYGIYHAFGYMGLITSVDGLEWQNAKHYKVSELSYTHAEHGQAKVQRLERPFVYVEDGVPKVMAVAAKESYTTGDSYSVYIPLKL